MVRQLSSDRDFTAFLASVRFPDVMHEGLSTATHLQRRLWEVKAAESRTNQKREAA